MFRTLDTGIQLKHKRKIVHFCWFLEHSYSIIYHNARFKTRAFVDFVISSEEAWLSLTF
jgi:hypothetical protein